MSFIPSVFRVLTGAIVLHGASLLLNISGDTSSFEALLVMGAQAKEKCISIGEKRVCFEDGAKKKNDGDDADDDDDDDDDDDNPKPGKTTKDCKKARCEPGLVVLDKPNKYGACCEAREGLPPPKTAEPEKCKSPGEVGTPPNCTCPAGTDFFGYRGCLNVSTWDCSANTDQGLGPVRGMRARTIEDAKSAYIAIEKQKNWNVLGPVNCTPQ